VDIRPREPARIALFRTREDSARSAAGLRRLGFRTATLPVLEAGALPFAPPEGRFDAVVAASARAFLNATPFASLPLYAVGARTRAAAEALGFRLAAPPAADASRLIETLLRRLKPDSSVLYLAGRDRKPALESALKERFALTIVETYEARARDRWSPAEIRALASCAGALHYSRRSAELAANLAEKAAASPHFLALAHVCLSADVAEPLQALGAGDVTVSAAPDEPSLFAALAARPRIFP
jgi:uroporphyrinogen-III synthase